MCETQHEHPAGASSWDLEKIKEAIGMKGVEVVTADQCMYGPTTWRERRTSDPSHETNEVHDEQQGDFLGAELNRRCDKRHGHQHLRSGRKSTACGKISRGTVGRCAEGIGPQRSKLHKINAVTEVTLKESNRKLPNPKSFTMRRSYTGRRKN